MKSIWFDGRGARLHAIERNPEKTGTPLVFVHGWLDHCHSFDWVADPLPLHSYALDFRGHGLSGHVATGAYDLSGYCDDLDALLASQKLDQVHLVGHSMGGATALVYAAACPERIASLTLIEALGPTGGPPQLALARVQRFGREIRKPSQKRTYASLEEAVTRVRENNSSLSPRAAEHMTRHGLKQTERGVEFTFDPAVRRHVAHSFSDEQIVAILEGVRARTQVIRGKAGYDFPEAPALARLAALKNPPVHVLDGGHHVHLDQPDAVARLVAAFIAEHP